MRESISQTHKLMISILVPCYNEEAVLHEFYWRTVKVINNIEKYDFELIFINDGSSDHTREMMAAVIIHGKF